MTMLRSTNIITLLSSLLLLSSSRAQQQCSLCFGGADANLTNTIGGATDGLPCGELVNDVEVDSDGCRQLQILGYQWCDCPDYPEEEYCPMCQDAFVDIPNRFKEIPGSDDLCEDRLFVKASSVESCDDAMKPGWVCGCPEAKEPDCAICGTDYEDDLQISKPDALLTINEVGSFTCQELVNQAVLGVLTVDQCPLVQTEAFDTCGCPGSTGSSSSETEGTTDEDPDTTTPDAATNEGVPVETDASTTSTDDSSAFGRRDVSVVALLGAVASQLLLELLLEAMI